MTSSSWIPEMAEQVERELDTLPEWKKDMTESNYVLAVCRHCGDSINLQDRYKDENQWHICKKCHDRMTESKLVCCPKCGSECKKDPDVDCLYLCEKEGCDQDYFTTTQQQLIDRQKEEIAKLKEEQNGWKEQADISRNEALYWGKIIRELCPIDHLQPLHVSHDCVEKIKEENSLLKRGIAKLKEEKEDVGNRLAAEIDRRVRFYNSALKEKSDLEEENSRLRDEMKRITAQAEQAVWTAQQGLNDLRAKLEAAEKEYSKLNGKYNLIKTWMDKLPFCPDHRDKQSGLSCRACEIERLEKELSRLKGEGNE